MKISGSLFLAAAVLAASPLLAADTYAVDKGHSEATFTIKQPAAAAPGKPLEKAWQESLQTAKDLQDGREVGSAGRCDS